MTTELKRLPGMDGEPEYRWHSNKVWVVQGATVYGSHFPTHAEAAADWNAMIDRIIEECRK